jgi:signal transduction histidine kinase
MGSRDLRHEQRTLILAPSGKDAALIAAALKRSGIDTFACTDIACLAGELEKGAAAILVEEEALVRRGDDLVAIVDEQPPWSDLPILLLTRPGSDSSLVTWALSNLGNVTLLERPVRIAALTSAVHSALRARERQYQTRAHLMLQERADRRKDEFLATLAHELRNPLAPLRNAVHVLRLSGAERVPGPALESALEMMDRQIDHLVRLVDDLMEVSRIKRGKIGLHKEVMDLRSAITSAAESCRPLFEEAHHVVTLRLPESPLMVKGDAVRLSQVFCNLLNNAARYTEPGGRITVEARGDDGEAIVSISDTGSGIEAAALPTLFDMFVQAGGGHGRDRSGLGIGLTLVRSLVEMHSGTVEAHSEGLGKGSKFTVYLPLARAVVRQPGGKGEAAGVVRGVPRVLVLDDNQDAADSLGAVLEMLGAEVRVTHSGREALEQVDSFRPAAVFLDLGMPGMDGYEVASRIRSTPEMHRTRLIAVTGWGQEKDRRQTSAAGFDHHLVKPADISSLQAVLASLNT